MSKITLLSLNPPPPQEQLFEIQCISTSAASCDGDSLTNMQTKLQYSNNPQIWDILSSTLALAFSCGASRIPTAGNNSQIGFSQQFISASGAKLPLFTKG